MEPFEEHVRRQPLREVPPDWREDILATARAAAQATSGKPARERWGERLRQMAKAWLWPHPVAWSVVGACWVVIAALNFSLREGEPVVAQKPSPMSAETMTELKRERLMFVELAGLPEKPDLDRIRKQAPQPRTERARVETV
jgi:hypothetical protein